MQGFLFKACYRTRRIENLADRTLGITLPLAIPGLFPGP